MALNIALYGHSGSGKTTVAEYLASKYEYSIARTGATCRGICMLVFQSESKYYLNRVTDAIKSIDENAWLRAALSRLPPNCSIVFDSMRFKSDYEYLRALNFSFWHIDAPLGTRAERLHLRGQEFNPEVDDTHPAEVELEGQQFDYLIVNDGSDVLTLYEKVDNVMEDITQAKPLGK